MAKYAEKEAPLLERIIMQEGLERTKAEDWARDEITRLREENARLRTAFRVNMLRAFPHMSHREIDVEIERAVIREKRSFATEGGKDG